MPRDRTTLVKQRAYWREQVARERANERAERQWREARLDHLRRLIRAYVATGREYRSPERLVLEAALRDHRDAVECDGWYWQWSRANGDLVRQEAEPVRKGAKS